MDVVFSGLKWRGLLVYMDDIVVYSETIQEHLALLEEVFRRLFEAGLKNKSEENNVGGNKKSGIWVTLFRHKAFVQIRAKLRQCGI